MYRSALSGMFAVLIGLGLSRFAYSPLIPAMVSQGWFSSLEASHLVAINLIGYFLGAIFLKMYAGKLSPVKLTAIALIFCVFGLFGRAIDFGDLWFAIWRFLVGFFGAFLVIITPSYILTSVANYERRNAGSIIFTGLGVGMMIAALLVAGFSHANVQHIWTALGVISLLIALGCWKLLPANPDKITQPNLMISSVEHQPLNRAVIFLIIAYSLCAIAFVPHLLFLVDYLTFQLTYSHSEASLIFALVGVGAILGGIFASKIASKVGIYRSLLLIIISCVIATLLIFTEVTWLICLSGFLIGLFFTAIVTLKSTRLLELEDAKHHTNLWSLMTIGFGLGQVLGTYIVIYVHHYLHNYGLSFSIAALIFFISGIFIFLAKKQPSA